jgi:hypothetical protein
VAGGEVLGVADGRLAVVLLVVIVFAQPREALAEQGQGEEHEEDDGESVLVEDAAHQFPSEV